MDDVDIGVALYDAQAKRLAAMGPLAYAAMSEKIDSDVFRLSQKAANEFDKAVLVLVRQYLKTAVGQAEWDYIVNDEGGPGASVDVQ